MVVPLAHPATGASRTVEGLNLAVPGLQGLVICLMPQEAPRSDACCRLLEDVFNSQGHAVLFRDSGPPGPVQPRESLEQLLGGTIDAVGRDPQSASLPVALFGAGPGTAPVLRTAVAWRARLQAVAVCGGRPQDGLAALPLLGLPTLLVVGGADDEALAAIDRMAMRHLPGAWRLETVPGAKACFAEPGCFETAAHHAASWFSLHLGRY